MICDHNLIIGDDNRRMGDHNVIIGDNNLNIGCNRWEWYVSFFNMFQTLNTYVCISYVSRLRCDFVWSLASLSQCELIVKETNGFSIINHSFWATPISRKFHIDIQCQCFGFRFWTLFHRPVRICYEMFELCVKVWDPKNFRQKLSLNRAKVKVMHCCTIICTSMDRQERLIAGSNTVHP